MYELRFRGDGGESSIEKYVAKFKLGDEIRTISALVLSYSIIQQVKHLSRHGRKKRQN